MYSQVILYAKVVTGIFMRSAEAHTRKPAQFTINLIIYLTHKLISLRFTSALQTFIHVSGSIIDIIIVYKFCSGSVQIRQLERSPNMLCKHLLNLPAVASIGSRKTKEDRRKKKNKALKEAKPLLIAASSSFQNVLPFPSLWNLWKFHYTSYNKINHWLLLLHNYFWLFLVTAIT